MTSISISAFLHQFQYFLTLFMSDMVSLFCWHGVLGSLDAGQLSELGILVRIQLRTQKTAGYLNHA